MMNILSANRCSSERHLVDIVDIFEVKMIQIHCDNWLSVFDNDVPVTEAEI